MNKPLTKTKLYGILGLIVTSALIYFISYTILIKPMQAELASMKDNVALFQDQVEKINNQSSNDQETKSNSVTEQIPLSEEPASILLLIEKIANTSGVTVNLLETVEGESSERSKEIPKGINGQTYTLEATAPSLAMANKFLTAFNQTNRLLNVEGLTVNEAENGVILLVTFTAFHASNN